MLIPLKKLMSYLSLSLILSVSSLSYARDLSDIKKEGILRHIGVPYANFITLYQEADDGVVGGLDAEIMKGFAKSLGLEYQYIKATWSNAFTLLNGQSARYIDGKVVFGDTHYPIQGDVIANGATILAWRKQVVDFSDIYFPSAVWLIARSDSALSPITPSMSITEDIKQVKRLIKGKDVLALKQSCLEPDLYNLQETGANIIFPKTVRKLNEMVPAILNNDAETTLLDVPDTLIALEKWPGEIKVIGPISPNQQMAVAFRKDSPQLRHAFNLYLQTIIKNGKYHQLVQKYYPSVFYFYADFFNNDLTVAP